MNWLTAQSHPLSESPTLARWHKAARISLVAGVVLAVGVWLVGGVGQPQTVRQFAYSYLLAYMFTLSLCLGGLFLVLLHHLLDAAWSVPIRRLAEHLACLLFPVMAVLWLPIGLLAPVIYPWMGPTPADHALHAKEALLNKPVWYIVSVALFLGWGYLAHQLRRWSLQQDQTGGADCTYRLRFHAAWGIFYFALSLTLAAILWVKSIQHQWFSTMYGVYYFAESVWTTLATVYVLSLGLRKAGPLRLVITPRQVHDLGVFWFAFTVFYAYIHFSQYFIIWNANIPEETFWYLQREQGTWGIVGLALIFGHFFLPFLALLRIDAKMTPAVTVPLAAWAWVMHFGDMAFNIMPPLHSSGFVFHVQDLACLAAVLGIVALAWLREFGRHAPFPLKDPRMTEALGVHEPPALVLAKTEVR